MAALTAQVAELEASLVPREEREGKRPERPCTPQRTAYHPQMTLEANSADKAVVGRSSRGGHGCGGQRKDWAEASCLISNLLAELEQLCRICREDSLVLTGRSPTGETVTIRLGLTWCWRQRVATSCWMQRESEGAPDG